MRNSVLEIIKIIMITKVITMLMPENQVGKSEVKKTFIISEGASLTQQLSTIENR